MTMSLNSVMISNTFDMICNIFTIVDSPKVTEIPDQELDKSLEWNINIDESLKLSITQSDYTFFLRCLDLNINFTDNLQHEHYFVKHIDIDQYYREIESVITMRVNTLI
jgi:hypothetical protein